MHSTGGRTEALAKVHRIKAQFGGANLFPRPELKETLPRHADMLRYDLAFHDPVAPSRVVFPIFKGRSGRTNKTITDARWHSFGLYRNLDGKPPSEEFIHNIEEWVTFRQAKNPGEEPLVPVTLGEFVFVSQTPIVGWR